MEYNISKEELLMKEYGRNVQQIVRHISNMENKEEQKKNLEAMIKVMNFLNGNFNKNKDNVQKIWDHLVIISDFKLAGVSPYPLPSQDNIFQKPSKDFGYPKHNTRNRQFGSYLEAYAKMCLDEENLDDQKEYIKYLINYIRLLHSNKNKGNVSSENIKREFSKLTMHKFDDMAFVNDFIQHLESNNQGGYQRHGRRYHKNNYSNKKYNRRSR